ncbi:FAER295Cp [Eremothecium gossypii FDAG1]|nr:FAER295Cp [Eremothecium gossypii FDAG1]
MEVKNIRDTVFLVPKGEGSHGNLSFFARLSNHQPSTHSQLKVKSYPLDQIKDQSVQESLVIRDLLHVLVGLEGIYIRYNNSYEPEQRRSGALPYDIVGPDFKIAKNMDPSLKSVAKRISKVGRLYVILSEFINRFEQTRYGTVLHRMCFVVRRFLTDDYLPFVVGKLERWFQEDARFGIRIMEQLLNEEIIYKARLLYELVMCVVNEMERRDKVDLAEADFENFIQDLKMGSDAGATGDSSTNGILITDTRVSPVAKGGVVLQMVLEKMKQNWGDQRNLQFLHQVWQDISAPYCEMLNEWLIKGDLKDPYEEFLISDTSQDNNIVLNSLNSERLWDTQYVIRKDGLTEQFQDRQLQYKVLMTGKLLNLFKRSCGLATLPHALEHERSDIATQLPEGTQLLVYVDKWYQRANQMCWDLLQEGYQLPRIMYQLHKHFMLYNCGEFQNKFFMKSMVELTRSRSESIQLKLQRNWQQYQKNTTEHKDSLILQLMTVRLDQMSLAEVIMQFEEDEIPEDQLNSNGNDVDHGDSTNGGSGVAGPTADGIDSLRFADTTVNTNRHSILQARNFNNLKDMLLKELDHTVTGSSQRKRKLHSVHHLQFELVMPFPLNALVSKPFIVEYQIIQRHLLLLMYYNRLLEDTWFEANKAWPIRARGPSTQDCMKRCRIIHNRLAQLVKVLSEYATHDVIAPDWRSLSLVLNGAPVPFSRLQMAVHDYLANVMAANLLTDTDLYRLVLQILEIIHRYCKFLSALRPNLTNHPYTTNIASAATALSAQDPVSPDTPVPDNLLTDWNAYLSKVSVALHDHLRALIEGIKHHSQRGHTAPRVLLLVERLAAFV